MVMLYIILMHISPFLRYKNKQTFLVGKYVLIIMVPIFIHNDVFEPSYNDLKFTSKTAITFVPT